MGPRVGRPRPIPDAAGADRAPDRDDAPLTVATYATADELDDYLIDDDLIQTPLDSEHAERVLADAMRAKHCSNLAPQEKMAMLF